jgi:hypothetical protein
VGLEEHSPSAEIGPGSPAAIQISCDVSRQVHAVMCVTRFELESDSRNSQVVGIAGIPGDARISGVGGGRHRAVSLVWDALRSDEEVSLSWNLRSTNSGCNINHRHGACFGSAGHTVNWRVCVGAKGGRGWCWEVLDGWDSACGRTSTSQGDGKAPGGVGGFGGLTRRIWVPP